MSNKVSKLEAILEQNHGVIRSVPVWLPRNFLPAGRRLKMHPDDLYAYGLEAGAIAERWFTATGVGDDETTMSHYYLGAGEESFAFPEAISLMGETLLGKECMDTYGTYVSFSKLYDYATALPLHIHPGEKYGSRVGMAKKPESYYFPVEYNQITRDHHYTYFGLNDGVTKEQFLECIRNYNKGDNQILNLSKAYQVKLGTGWFMPEGLLHAPASVVTYEPQCMSDSLVFYQNVIESKYTISDKFALAMVPKDFEGDVAEYLLEMIDWEGNFGDFRAKYYHEPIPVRDVKEMEEEGYYEEWVSYGSEDFAAKRLVVKPGRKVVIKDETSYGFIMMQGVGLINGLKFDTPSIIRFGQQTADEGFVIKSAANEGIVIENTSEFTDLVMLKNYNADNKAWKQVFKG